jgi:hypothetical protein
MHYFNGPEKVKSHICQNYTWPAFICQYSSSSPFCNEKMALYGNLSCRDNLVVFHYHSVSNICPDKEEWPYIIMLESTVVII